ncbi:hypothetical protein TrVE_jg10910 [Triparma verrucosa]|nr:hypothetical protein TrVE_jg10910 [Triparma verrucosa]
MTTLPFLHPPPEPILLQYFTKPAAAAIRNPRAVWPVNRVHLIGRNYAAHAAEMGDDPKKSSPFFFQKPASAIVDTTKTSALKYPRDTTNYHYEAELVLGIGKDSAGVVPLSEAMSYITSIGVGCDLTRRDLQNEAKEKRRPWDDSKGVEDSGPIGGLIEVSEGDDWWYSEDSLLTLTVDGVEKQRTLTKNMIWSPEEIVHYISKRHDLKIGDVIFTGTPEGVGKLERGEKCVLSLEGGTEKIENSFVLE